MKSFEICIDSVNNEYYAKKITSLVMTPDCVSENTSFLLFSHGWGGNRFQHRDKMEQICESYNRIAVCVEYRQSGYDFDSTTGAGSYLPYDASFLQVFDVLNSLRQVYELYPQCDRSRTVHYGGSQGGSLALLSAIFAPRTFAAIYASSPVVRLTEEIQTWAGRTFDPYELNVRDVLCHAEMIRCPVWLEHGTNDTTVPHFQHTMLLEKRLQELGKKHNVVYYEGGDHSLQPTITKINAFNRLIGDVLAADALSEADDFTAKRTVTVPCGDRTLQIDWGKDAASMELFRWLPKDSFQSV